MPTRSRPESSARRDESLHPKGRAHRVEDTCDYFAGQTVYPVWMAERFGRYETIRTIASGGMATVHLARAVGAGGFERLVAI